MRAGLTYDALWSAPARVTQTLVLVEEEAANTFPVDATLVSVDFVDSAYIVLPIATVLGVGVLADSPHVEVVQLKGKVIQLKGNVIWGNSFQHALYLTHYFG